MARPLRVEYPGAYYHVINRVNNQEKIFKNECSRWLHDAFDLRQRSDCVAEYHASPEDAESTLNKAETFVAKVKDVLSRAT